MKKTAFYSYFFVALSLNANAYEEVPDNIPTWLYCQADEEDVRHHSDREVYINFKRKHAWKVYEDSWDIVMVNGSMDVRYTSTTYPTAEEASYYMSGPV